MDISEVDMLEAMGAIDGQKFFSRSPFRSKYFLAVTTMGLACTICDLFLLYRYWHQLSPPAILTLWMALCGIVGPWIRALRYHDRVRRLNVPSGLVEAKSGSMLHVVLSVAAGATNDTLFFSLATILLLLVYVGRLLS